MRPGARAPTAPAALPRPSCGSRSGHPGISFSQRGRAGVSNLGFSCPWLLYLHLRYAETSVLNDTPILNVTCES